MEIDKKRSDSLAKYRVGWKVTDICKSECITRATFYNWLNRYNKYGAKGLVKKSTRPKTIYPKLSDETKKTIIEIRKRTRMNEYAIQSILSSQGIDVSHATIYKILRQNDLVNKLSKERKKRTYTSYERSHPNSMWQTDLSNWNERVVIAYIDDHSRFITGAKAYRHGFASNVIELFGDAINEHGKPREVLTDHGTQFYSRTSVSDFDRFCNDNGIKHILGSICKPTTTGKIERWFGTFKAQIENFSSISAFVKYYNYERPHRGIGYVVPASRFHKNQ